LSKYDIALKEADLAPRTSGITNFNGALNFKYFLGDNEARYGMEVAGVKTNLSYFNSLGYKLAAMW
jgi:hypothetical protein